MTERVPAENYASWLPPYCALIMLLVVLVGCAPEEDSLVRIARRSSAYLWQAQDADGAWRSQIHGLARSGQSWTAFTLFHLLALPERVVPLREAKVRAALAFLESRAIAVNPTAAALGFADDAAADYPVYTTAYALRAYLLARERGLLTPTQEALIPRMANYLFVQQHTAGHGVAPDDPAYGGWGMGASLVPRGPGSAGGARPYADVAHTRRALEALVEAARVDTAIRTRLDSASVAAQAFLAKVQKRELQAYNGGFYYTPVVPHLNKAGAVDVEGSGTPGRSYATATCDGVLALMATGMGRDTEPVLSAAAYLAAHDTLAHAAGLPEQRAAWREVMFFYHLAGRAEVNARLGAPGPWRERVTELLLVRQREDGSFVNPAGAPNKEDDPILATTLALTAISSALEP